QFAGDLGRANPQSFAPAEMTARGDHQLPRRKGSLDAGRGVDLQGPLRHQLADEAPFDDRLPDVRVGVQQVALFLDDQPAVGPVILGEGLGDLIIPQVDMAAAALAHGRFGSLGHVQIRAALKTANAPQLNDGLWRFRDRFNDFPDSEMVAATLANRRESAARFRLRMPALRARDRLLVPPRALRATHSPP